MCNGHESFCDKFKKAAKHLLIPMLVTFEILIIVDCISDPSRITSGNYWNEKMMSLIFASGVDLHNIHGISQALEFPGFSLLYSLVGPSSIS